jgi:hypothetical protein
VSGGYSGEGAGQGMVEKRGEDDKEEGIVAVVLQHLRHLNFQLNTLRVIF